MKAKTIVIKIIQFLFLLMLLHIYGDNSLFLYLITLSLYNIYLSCFSHITLKETYQKIDCQYSKFKILKYVAINIIIICSLFIISSILISDAISISLNIENTFLPYLMMSLSIATEPLVKILSEYLASCDKPKLSSAILTMYYILESFLLLIIGVLTIKVIKLPIYISISLLYLSKIFSFIIVLIIAYMSFKKSKTTLEKSKEKIRINYKKEVKEILMNNSTKSIINIIKNGYYYISIILLYMVLSTRYSYNIDIIEKDLTFVYLYGILIVSIISDIVLFLNKSNYKKENIINYIYTIFKKILTVTIIFGITSPLICKIIFGISDNYMYLMILIFLSIFIALFDATYEHIKNKKIIYTSLTIGIISKFILTVPLINSFYRMGYNLIYGDITSTMVSMFISIVINYIYIKAKSPKEKTLEKILTTLYESLLLCIILVLLQFIIPIKTDNYLKSLILLCIYVFISIIFIKIKKKKRG